VRYFVLRNPRALISSQGPTAIAGGDGYQETITPDSTLELASMPLQEDTQKLTEPEIQVKLTEELGVLLKQRGINPLLGMPGMIRSVLVAGHNSRHLQALTYIMILQLKSFTQFSSVL
jgi:hypothetical protein